MVGLLRNKTKLQPNLVEVELWLSLVISILTPLGETDGATIMNGIGQGSFAAALASSLNIGCAVDGITRGIASANIGEMELNSLIFQDVGQMLESKQLRANTSKS